MDIRGVFHCSAYDKVYAPRTRHSTAEVTALSLWHVEQSNKFHDLVVIFVVIIQTASSEVPCESASSEFLNETYPAKTTGMGLLYGENCVIITSSVFD